MNQEAEQPQDGPPLRLCDLPGSCIVENQAVRLEFSCQYNGLSLTLPHPSPQAADGHPILDLVPRNPLRLGDLHTPRAALTALDNLFIDRFRNVRCPGNLAEEIQATDSGEGDEGAGIQDEDHSPAPSWWRRVSRSRRRSSGE